ncbi:MAG: glycosyltransferase family 4 protein [Bacteroidaceae bacterium]|nr:glycosyltransferase family 4 protein [Bacteroidaceae bacterium]
MKRRVLFITQYFYPETFRGNDIAFDMAGRGWDVTVVTAVPNYPRGRFFRGYGLWKRRREEVNGVHVVRVPVVPRGNNPLTLALNYLSYALCASVFTFFHLLRHRYDLCFLQQLSPVTTCLPAVVFHKMTGRPLLTWVLDLWPESLKAAGGIRNRHVLAAFAAVARMEYRHSSRILISSQPFRQAIAQQQKDFGDKTVWFPNWAEPSRTIPTRGLKLPTLPEGFRIMFAGNVGEAQDFDHIVEAARLARGTDIRFVIVGDGRKRPWVEEQIQVHGLQDNLSLVGHFPPEAMYTLFAQADLMLAALKDEPVFNLTLPAKIQTYMASGRPIVAMANGAVADTLHEAQCGRAVAAGDPEALIGAINSMRQITREEREQMGRNGQRYCHAHFDKQTCLDHLYQIIEQL